MAEKKFFRFDVKDLFFYEVGVWAYDADEAEELIYQIADSRDHELLTKNGRRIGLNIHSWGSGGGDYEELNSK